MRTNWYVDVPHTQDRSLFVCTRHIICCKVLFYSLGVGHPVFTTMIRLLNGSVGGHSDLFSSPNVVSTLHTIGTSKYSNCSIASTVIELNSTARHTHFYSMEYNQQRSEQYTLSRTQRAGSNAHIYYYIIMMQSLAITVNS